MVIKINRLRQTDKDKQISRQEDEQISISALSTCTISSSSRSNEAMTRSLSFSSGDFTP